MNNAVSFYLNGRAVTIENPRPDLLLIDYLRSPDVALAGPKKPCGQGGCGGCTVILSTWDEERKKVDHRAINACLRPVCALGGLVITTVEGTGAARKPDARHLQHTLTPSRTAAPIGQHHSPVFTKATQAALDKGHSVHEAVQARRSSQDSSPLWQLNPCVAECPSEHSHEGMNPVAHRLALNNGSQCGYCSVGFVMNMSEFLINNPKATKKEIEDAFDGNLCRCTGYRSILTGMKTFASDWTYEDEKSRMQCLEDYGCASQLPGFVTIPFPDAARRPAAPVSTDSHAQKWCTPITLTELAEILHRAPARTTRLIHGNTSYGVYKEEYPDTTLFVDIRLIPDLHSASRVEGKHLVVASGTSYRDFINLLVEERNRLKFGDTTTLGALEYMARRTAGRIIRNAASLGGNTMLVLKHIVAGEPFPSDLFTTMVAVEARLTYLVLGPDGHFVAYTKTAAELVKDVEVDKSSPPLADRIVITAYMLPLGDCDSKDVVLAHKVALREVNAHSIVNATTRFTFDDKLKIESAALVFGGIAPYPWRATKTEKKIEGRDLTLADVVELSKTLEGEVKDELKKWPRRENVPDEGFTDEYRTQLTISFLYKAIVNALVSKDTPVPPNVKSSGEDKWGKWEVSTGKQVYKPQPFTAPVGQPYIKINAMYQTSGQVHYTQELAVPPLTLNGAFVQSRRALANYRFEAPSGTDLLKHLQDYAPRSFIDLITSEDIKNGGINLQGMALDQPLFAEKLVSYVGQSIAMVLATSEEEAIRIADYVSKKCVKYTDPGEPWTGKWSQPIIDLLDAIEKGSIFPDAPVAVPYVAHIWKITRPGSRLDWVEKKEPIDRTINKRHRLVGSAPCLVIESSQLCGGQAHFYMETQACIAMPADEGRINITSSTQSPAQMHNTVAMALALQYHQVAVEVPPVGGGFGGKTEQTRFVAGPTAVAAKATKCPVRVVVPRDEDTAMIGKRHAYYGQYQIAVDDGSVCPQDRGIIHGLQVKMWGDGGAFYDCSFIVSNCVQLRTDNAYRIANFESQIDVCRTNTAPSTAMRGFGDIQGKNIIENAIDDAAVALGMQPEDMREKNLYDIGDVTPFGQALSYCYMKQVWNYVKEISQFKSKCNEVEAFNKGNKWRKRGIAIVPVKYGSGYNLVALEQAAAVVVVNQADGTIVIHQGGVDIGQGLVTQAQQVAAYTLGLPMEMFYIDNSKTRITPNATSTGASTGTPYACWALKETCEQLRSRLMELGYQMLKDKGNDWCQQQGIDFWNYGERGWATVVKGPNKDECPKMIWQFLVMMANTKRVSLVASFNVKVGGGEVPVPAMTFKKEADQLNIPGIERIKDAQLGGGVDSFVGFTYSAACSVAEIDVLTGEVKIISSDIVYDMGFSINPAIDIGQIEGAFVQGIGYLLTEKLVFEPEGEEKGRLNTTNTWRYKVPAATTIPLAMNTYLFPRGSTPVEHIPEDPNEIFSSKEVGEPPLVLANSVFFAIKAAIRASRIERKLDPLFRFDAPATVQEVRRACEVKEEHLAI